MFIYCISCNINCYIRIPMIFEFIFPGQPESCCLNSPFIGWGIAEGLSLGHLGLELHGLYLGLELHGL
jgi:hypothetical protein